MESCCDLDDHLLDRLEEVDDIAVVRPPLLPACLNPHLHPATRSAATQSVMRNSAPDTMHHHCEQPAGAWEETLRQRRGGACQKRWAVSDLSEKESVRERARERERASDIYIYIYRYR